MPVHTDVRLQSPSWKGHVFFLVAGLLFSLYKTTVQSWWDPFGFGPDPVLILVIYLGFQVPFFSGFILVTVIGFIHDAGGGGILGLHPGVYQVVYWLATLMRLRVDPVSPVYIIPLVFGFALVSGLMTAAAFYMFEERNVFGFSAWTDPAAVFLVSAGTDGLAAPIVFGLLNLFRPRSEDQMDKE